MVFTSLDSEQHELPLILLRKTGHTHQWSRGHKLLVMTVHTITYHGQQGHMLQAMHDVGNRLA